ncbi:mRNA-degrading endonuclease toxin of MazEF toxin-antitoxin module [Cellulomonas oligotrophica]|uniref:mRNA-degrading endonuclease toxin of MazEF toxin-antitoxin module n=1 Tax=Cellulomonas oligotrophica TaxID=931536 RepID=A0A7Y9FI38_9CELL|nr:mRNA-degrading endonuclease toxin of MazEF toxin-antitoxin module [Cellulomonas oligotrophica]
MDFPFSSAEPSGSQYKRRPALVLNAVGSGADEAIVFVMVTGSAARLASPSASDIPVRDWQAVGLARESVVRTRRIWTGQKRDVVRAIGRFDAATLELVRDMVVDLVSPQLAPKSDPA